MLKKLIALGVVGSVAASFVACGGDDTDPEVVTATDDGMETDDGAGGMGGEMTDPVTDPNDDCGGEISGGGEDLGLYCEESTAPPNCNISSFESDTYFTDGKWGDNMSLTGETFYYGTTADTGEVSEVMGELVGDAFVITGEVYQYAGWGFSFGPCTDATHFEGLEFTLQGTFGGEQGELEVQMQSNDNYPTNDSNGIGSCTPESEDTMWSDCANNKWIAGGIDESTSVTYRIPWADFTGGSPTTSLSVNQLRGVQFQINCGDPDTLCEPNLSLYDLRFYRNQDPNYGPMPTEEETTD